MAIDVVMWLLSIVLLICILATCAINIITSYEKQDKLGDKIANKVWEPKKEGARIPTRKMAMISSVATIVVLIATIIVGACSSHGREAFHAFLP